MLPLIPILSANSVIDTEFWSDSTVCYHIFSDTYFKIVHKMFRYPWTDRRWSCNLCSSFKLVFLFVVFLLQQILIAAISLPFGQLQSTPSVPTIQNVKILLHLLKTKPVKYNSKILKEEAVLVLFACVIIPKTNNGILLPNLF